MTYTQEKIDAYKKLDEAVEALRKAYGYHETGEILNGYVLLTNEITFDEIDQSNPNKDDKDLSSAAAIYPCRGQDPTLTYGILMEAVRHYNGMSQGYSE